MMDLELFEPLPDLKKAREIWLRFRGNQSYFLSWGWMENWIRSLPDSARVRFAVLRESDRPRLAFFMGENGYSRNGMFRGKGYYLNATGKEAYDGLCIEYNAMAAAADIDFREVLDLMPGRWDEFFLPGLDPGGYPGRQIFGDLSPYRVVIEREEPAPFVDLEKVRKRGDYLSLLSASTRSQIRRSYRNLSASGRVSLHIPGHPEEAVEIYDEMVRLHQSAWISRGWPGHFASSYNYGFHLNLIRTRFPLGEIQLLRIAAGDVTIGCLYNFVWDGKVYYYQGGINYEADPNSSPGLVCHAEAVQFNAALGYSVYDFMAGKTRYKSSLATDENRIVWARVQKQRIRFAIETQLRAMKYRIQPPLNPS